MGWGGARPRLSASVNLAPIRGAGHGHGTLPARRHRWVKGGACPGEVAVIFSSMTNAHRPRLRPQGAVVPALLIVTLFTVAGFSIEPAAAQSILNTERFQLREVDGFHFSGDFSMALQRGNTKLLDVSGSGMTGWLTGRHWGRVIFGGRYLSNDERAILDQEFVQLRYSYIFSPHTRSFHFVQTQRNETLRLRSRWLVGSGIQTNLIRGDGARLAVGTGVMQEWERLDAERLAPGDPTELNALRMANLAVFSRDFSGGGRILNILYLQPSLADFGDLRILNDLGVMAPISPRVRLTSSVEWRRDTRPPSVLERDDVTFRMGVGIDVR